MDFNKIEVKKKFDQAVAHYVDELHKLRTGRANASMLEGVKVEVYGQMTPLQHIATVTVLDAQMLQIAPFDPSNLEAITAAIRDNKSLGLNPSDDGRVVRVPIPPMTQERRLEVVKSLKEKTEEIQITMRNIRHDVLRHARQQEKDKAIAKDDVKHVEKELTKLMDEARSEVDNLMQHKESEIMTV